MYLPRIKHLTQGFSLLEILVVIAIIAIVSALGLGFTESIQRSTRNAQRTSDLSSIQSALQQFYADQNHFPNTLVLTSGAALTNCTGETGCTVTKTYLSKTPVDPFSGTTDPYCYSSQISATNTANCSGTPGLCHYYELCAKIENPNGTPASCSCDAQDNFKVTPL